MWQEGETDKVKKTQESDTEIWFNSHQKKERKANINRMNTVFHQVTRQSGEIDLL